MKSHQNTFIEEKEKQFWQMVEEKGVGSDIRFAQACRDFLLDALREAQEATVREIRGKVEKYKCDFNWDFEKKECHCICHSRLPDCMCVNVHMNKDQSKVIKGKWIASFSPLPKKKGSEK